MQNFHHVTAFEQLGQRIKRAGFQRVDQPHPFAIRKLYQAEVSSPGSLADKFGVDTDDVTVEPLFYSGLKLCGSLNHPGYVSGCERYFYFTLIGHEECDNPLFKPMVIGCLFRVLLRFPVLVVTGDLGYGCRLGTGKLIPLQKP